MIHGCTRPVLALSSLVFLGLVSPATAQPAYKLGVKPDLKPLATIQFEGNTLKRSEIQDDPGFRLQYHFKKEGKTVAQIAARAATSVEVPLKEAGMYTVVLELFYPAYKGGTAQKGEFKPISNVLTLKVEGGEKPDEPVKVTVIEAPSPKK
jgi:hypothetical protein